MTNDRRLSDGTDRRDVLRNAIAAAQAGWIAQDDPDPAERAHATAHALQIMAAAEGKVGKVNLYLALCQLVGAVLAAAGRDPKAELAGMAADLDTLE